MVIYYARDGQPLDLMGWAGLREDEDYRRVALDRWVDGTWVSTVWLGIDLSFGNGVPLIFETMAFGPTGTVEAYEEFTRRYYTEEQARQGHREVVAELGRLLDTEPMESWLP